jgi:hypothetical protein
MINLIPPAAKKNIILEYWIRVVSVWLIVWGGTLVLSMLLFLPTYVLLDLKVAAYADSAAMASKKIANYQTIASELLVSSKEAQHVVSTLTIPQATTYITQLRTFETAEVSFNALRFSREKATSTQSLSVSGVATNRQELAGLRERLLADFRISGVELPLSSLAKDRDIQFSMTVSFHNATTS